jgi:hypothetical protein
VKPSARKSMRVATTFTGVAACAAFAAPTAMAATGTGGHQLWRNAIPHTVRPDNTTVKSCVGGTSNWFHLAYNKSHDLCFGGKGKVIFSNSQPVATSFCGGNNTGWIKGFYYTTGKSYFTYFGHGTFYAHIPNTTAADPLVLASMHISNYSGNDKCGFP